MNKFIESLLPARLQKRKALADEERLKLLSTVPDTDNGLRAIEDILTENLLQEFYVVIDPNRDDTTKLRACEGLRVHFYALQKIETERERATEWRKQQEAK